MNMKNRFRLGALLLLIGSLATSGVLVYKNKMAKKSSRQQAALTQEISTAVPSNKISSTARPANFQPDKAKISKRKSTAKRAGSAKPEPMDDPEARLALSFVGADLEFEQRWIAAINNPDLSAKERSNLIEDLNEDGFSNPKNPSKADLPLIISRIALLETISENPMDDANAAAFGEAYKDLMIMYLRLTQ